MTSVTVTKGLGNHDSQYNYDIPAATNSIGKGSGNGTCGSVTIGGVEGAITESPYTYPAPATYTLLSAATTADVGKLIGSDGKIYADVAAATAAGGTVLKSGEYDYYWSGSEGDEAGIAWNFSPSHGWYANDKEDDSIYVRACLVF